MARAKTVMNSIRKFAETNEHPGIGKQQIIAFITNPRGSIVSKATNSYLKTHPMQAEYAEKVGKEDAIYLLNNFLEGIFMSGIDGSVIARLMQVDPDEALFLREELAESEDVILDDEDEVVEYVFEFGDED